MRLICPNCSAQYEIDASLIPDEGRDVQCSNCGHTWFELPPAPPEYADAPEPEEVAQEPTETVVEDEEPAGTEEAEVALAPEPEPEFEPEEEFEPEPEQEPEAEPDLEPERVAARDEDVAAEAEPERPASTEPPDDEEPSTAARAIEAASEMAEDDAPVADPYAAAAAAGANLRRRSVDDEALSILREEADRELARRRAPPTAPLETQTDMPLDEVRKRATPSRALRARMARSEDDEASPPKKAGKKPDPRVQSADEGYEAPRRDLLPDIDEINSSLKSRKARAEAGPDAAAEQRRGFRSGFLLMVLLAAVMIFAYAWAPAIAAAVPSLEGPLLVYVDWANGVRDWIDGLLGRA